MAIVTENAENLNPEELRQFEVGLRVLAKIIARAYRHDLQTTAVREQSIKDKIVMPELLGTANGRLTMSVSEVAKALGTSNSTVYAAVRQGQIPVIKWGKRILIPKIALAKMLDEAKPHIG